MNPVHNVPPYFSKIHPNIILPWGYSGRGVKLITHLHLVLRLKNAWSYASTAQYAFMALCLVKRGESFTFNFTLPSTPRSSDWPLPFKFSDQNLVCISHFSHGCYMSRLPHPPSFDHPNNIWWSVRLMKFLIMQSCSILNRCSRAFLTEHHAMKAYWGSGGIAPLILWPRH